MTVTIKPSLQSAASFTLAIGELPDEMTGEDLACFVNGIFNAYNMSEELRLNVLMLLLGSSCDYEIITSDALH